ncbi:MAG: GNAT family N-acetyltransferase [Ginsengibacter sp.]
MLRHEKIFLRPLEDDDKIELAQLANNKKIWNNVRDHLPFPYTIEDAVSFINFSKQEKASLIYAIEWDGHFCGVIGLVAQADVYRRTAEIGYWLGEPFWNKGIATEAVRLITDYGFTQLGYLRIHTGIFEFNIGSMKVLEKNGYNKDGIFEKNIFKNGKILDEHRYSKINNNPA